MDEVSQEVMKQGIEVVLKNYVDPLLKRIWNEIKKVSVDTAREISVDTNFAFREYLKEAFKKCSQIKTVLYRTDSKYLYSFFEVPTVRKVLNFHHPSMRPDERKANTIDDIFSLANESHYIILRGSGGSGKSTLMKHLFLDELSHKDLIPVYLQLKDINDIKGELDFREFVLDALQRFDHKLNMETLECALESGCFLFLLDGYDEVLSNYSGQFFHKLEVFCDRYPNNYFIVSSRPRKESDFLGGNRFTVLEACPFSLQEAKSLVRKIGYVPEVCDRFIEALETGLYEKHDTFASNPLLLIVMLMMFDNYAEIPEKLHIFYEEAFNTMYQKHDVTKEGYRRERKSNIQDYDQFRMIFSCFCFISYEQGETEFSWDRLASIFQQVKEMPFCKSDFQIDAYVDDLIEGLCVLYQDGTKYLFTHRSFQEYFAAVFLERQSDPDMTYLSLLLISNDVNRALNDEVFQLLKGIDESKFQNNIILPIMVDFERKMYYGPYSQLSDRDKFSYYFLNLFSKVKYDFVDSEHNDEYERWGGKDSKTFDFMKTDCQSKVWFAYYTMTSFDFQTNFDGSNENTDIYETKLLKYLRKKTGYTRRKKGHYLKPIEVEDLLKDMGAQQLLMKTPVGHRVIEFGRIRNQIESRKVKQRTMLSNLMQRKNNMETFYGR